MLEVWSLQYPLHEQRACHSVATPFLPICSFSIDSSAQSVLPSAAHPWGLLHSNITLAAADARTSFARAASYVTFRRLTACAAISVQTFGLCRLLLPNALRPAAALFWQSFGSF